MDDFENLIAHIILFGTHGRFLFPLILKKKTYLLLITQFQFILISIFCHHFISTKTFTWKIQRSNQINLIKGLCLSHMFFLASSHKKKWKSKKLSPHRNHYFRYFFCKSVLSHTLWKKKSIHAITHKKFSNKRRKTSY